jgi:hypothetical protein
MLGIVHPFLLFIIHYTFLRMLNVFWWMFPNAFQLTRLQDKAR